MRSCGKGREVKKSPSHIMILSALIKMYLGGEACREKRRQGQRLHFRPPPLCGGPLVPALSAFGENDYHREGASSGRPVCQLNAIHQVDGQTAPDQWDSFLTWLDDYEFENWDCPARPGAPGYGSIPQRLLARRYDGDENKKDIHEKDFSTCCGAGEAP